MKTMQRFLVFTTALTLSNSALQAAEKLTSASSPNIVLILTDDHGWSQMSQAMDPRVPASVSRYLETPNMNRLANAGMRFTNGYSPAPLCTPTRRSILCGAATARCGSEFRSKWIPADHMTIPKALKLANPDYRCAHFGKWGELMISTPEQCGYDASDGMTGNNTGGMPPTLGVQGGHADGPPHFIDNDDPKRTRTVTDRAIEFMQTQARADKPFYVQISYYAQHLSVVCTEETLAKYEAKGAPDRGYTQAWAAMMEELDHGVGRVLDAIDELDIEGNTYVFFTADNGGRGTVPGGDTGRKATNHPLTGAKQSLYEGGIRVPFLARGPGIEPGSVCHTPVVGYDFLPTFYDLAGGKAGPEALTGDVDGVSICKLFDDPHAATLDREGNAVYFHRPGRGFSAIRQGDHKLIVFWRRNGTIARRELYDVGENPVEQGRDFANENKAKADAMQETLLTFLKAVSAETPSDIAPKRKRPRTRPQDQQR
ncbi:MAG: sulfatase [Planctomycetes bacterium]|nr:sulfatase [Planctomycetota bacterium]